MKNTVLWITLAAACMAQGGADVTSSQAACAVRGWLAETPCPLGTKLPGAPSGVRTVVDAQGAPLFHVVELQGGGFVVTSGHTGIDPIVCFSGGGAFDDGAGSPLGWLLRQDMADQLAELGARAGTNQMRKAASVAGATGADGASERLWRALLEKGADTPGRMKSISSASQIADLRVPPLVKSQWNQDNWKSGQSVFNKQTPANAVCGCVATAGAQIMRYWSFPDRPRIPGRWACSLNGELGSLPIADAPYDWSQMPYAYEDVPTLSADQIAAISRLTKEVGAAVGMGYTTTKKGSSANTFALTAAFTNTFGYASSKVFAPAQANWLTYSTALAGDWRNAMLASLDASMPVSVSLKAESGGHSVIADGYGLHGGVTYVHFNMGWSGSYDVWYALLKEKMTNYAFFKMAGMNYNIHKSATGDVMSGRVLNVGGSPVSDATVTLKTPSGRTKTAATNARGIWYFRIDEAGAYFVSAAKATLSSASSRVIVERLCADMTTVGNRWGVELTVKEPPLEPAETPVISPSKGSYTGSSVTVSITCATKGAEIRYTTNGSTPTQASALYTGPFAVTGTTTVKARAFKTGMRQSDLAVMRYEQNVFKGKSNLAAAVDVASGTATFSASATDYVYGQTAKTYDGVDAVLLLAYATSRWPMALWNFPSLRMSVSGPGLLKFRAISFKRDATLATVSCSVDGVKKVSASCEDWQEFVVTLVGSGSHEVVWTASGGFSTYAAKTDVGKTYDLIAIDAVDWTPGSVSKRTVSYNLNGAESGTLSSASASAYPGEKVTVPAGEGLSRTGYVFGGWNTAADGSGESIWKGGSYTVGDQDATLYARWCKIVEVPFDYPAEGGTHTFSIADFGGRKMHMVGTFPSWASTAATDDNGNFYGGRVDENFTFQTAGMKLHLTVEPNDSEDERSFEYGLVGEEYATVPLFVCRQQGNRAHALSSITIEATDRLVAGASQTLRCIGLYRDGKSEALTGATWSIYAGAAYASVDGKTGVLSANGSVTTERTVTVTCTRGDLSATRQVVILPAVALSDALSGAGGLAAQSANGWFGAVGAAGGGVSSAWCGSCAGGAKWFEFEMAGGSKLTFDFKLSAGLGRVLRIYDDGELVKTYASLAEDDPWLTAAYEPADSADRTIRIVYEAAEAGAVGVGDECQLTNLKLTGPDLSKSFVVVYAANGGGGTMSRQYCTVDVVHTLSTNRYSAPAGKRFAGWRCSNGKRYDDGVLFFNLALPGETVTMTAIWE